MIFKAFYPLLCFLHLQNNYKILVLKKETKHNFRDYANEKFDVNGREITIVHIYVLSVHDYLRKY